MRATSEELARSGARVGIRILRMVLRIRRVISYFFDRESFIRTLELILRRLHLYVMKVDNLLQRSRRRLNGQNVWASNGENSFWRSMHQWKIKKGEEFFFSPVATEGEDFLGLNLDKRHEVHEWPEHLD